jgi:hypothetical protein
MTNHRRDVRPRYGRIGVLAAAITVSAIAALAGFGVLATSSAQAGAGPKPASYSGPTSGTTPDTQGSGALTGDDPVTPPGDGQTGQDPSTGSTPTGGPGSGNQSTGNQSTGNQSTGNQSTGTPGSGTSSDSSSGTPADQAVPADSGSGRRIVFSQSLQRVWLLGSQSNDVEKTYLVSGSVTNNLQPGTYSVYSKSRWAVGIDDSGVMQYFVRFTQGPTGAAIGFHSIPTKDGVALQTRAQLGTPQSHGCIRQYLPEAIALWNFAPIGTKVVVVA